MMEADVMIGAGMKVTCSREEFVGRLGIVSRAVSTRSSVQILAGVLLDAAAGELRLAATDMELSLRTSLEAQVESDGSVVVPGRLLVDIARLLPDSDVQIEHRVEDGVLAVTCGSASYRLHTYSAEDFPRLPDVDHTPHRRPVPEREATPAGAVRARGDAATERAARGRPPRGCDGAAQLAAPVALRRRRAEYLRPDAGRRRGEGVAPGAVRGRSARDRLQPRVPARRHRVRPVRRGPAQADFTASPRAHPGRGRRLLVPDHADQARRLTGDKARY